MRGKGLMTVIDNRDHLSEVSPDDTRIHRIIFTKATVKRKAICACAWESTADTIIEVQNDAMLHLDNGSHQMCEPKGFGAIVHTLQGRWVRMNSSAAHMPWLNENSRIQGNWNDFVSQVTHIVFEGV